MTYEGKVTLPAGGWVAARAYAAERQADAWPTMHARPFAHTSPVWIGSIGSTDSTMASAAAADLIRAVDASQTRAAEAYGDRPMLRLNARFDAAREALEALLIP